MIDPLAQAFPTPALRKVREERGTRRVAAASKVKSLSQPADRVLDDLLPRAGGRDDEAAGGFLFDVGFFLGVDQIESAFGSGRGIGERRRQGAVGAAYFLTFLQHHGRVVIDGGRYR